MFHVDLDEYLAAVEMAAVAGAAGQARGRGRGGVIRSSVGVVATVSYKAPEFGIRSGMPLRTATKRCPEAVFLPPDPPAYEKVSERVMATVR